MKKKSIFSLILVACMLIVPFALSGCGGETFVAQEWLNACATAQRNWQLVGNAKDTLESRTIVVKETSKSYDYDAEAWNISTETTTIVRSGYGADMKYHVTLEEYAKNGDVESYPSKKEIFMGKVEDDSWVIYEYNYVNNIKPETPTTTTEVATTPEDYIHYITNTTFNDSPVYAIFGSNHSDSLEEYIYEEIANLDDFSLMEIFLYGSLFEVSLSSKGDEKSVGYSVSNLDAINSVMSAKSVIKNNRYHSSEMATKNTIEKINDEGKLEVVGYMESLETINIAYIGTVTMPTVVSTPI